jgi:hypothetical protein
MKQGEESLYPFEGFLARPGRRRERERERNKTAGKVSRKFIWNKILMRAMFKYVACDLMYSIPDVSSYFLHFEWSQDATL